MICPICRSKETSNFAKKNGYDFYRCINCKTIFLPSLPSQNELNTYYTKQFSYPDGLHNETIIRKRSKIIIKKIKRLVPQSVTLSDVGSGYGFFIDEANKAGYEAIGIEPSLKMTAYSNKNYLTKTYAGELKEFIKSKKKQFDIVTCIHVIEHVSSPKEFISLLFKLVKPGGLLYIETPNSDSHLLYAEKEKYTFLIPPDHLWLFSKKSIQNLLPKNTQAICVNTYSYPEHFMGIVKAILNKNFKKKVRIKKQVSNKQKVNVDITNIIALRKIIFYYLFDKILAPLLTNLLNVNHKGSILELYIKKNDGKCDL